MSVSHSKLSERRIIVLLLDGVGIGELPDAAEYGDEGSDTLAHICEAVEWLSLPNLERMGMGNIKPLKRIRHVKEPLASYGMMAELSKSKDTLAGHWELMGLVTEKPFPTYPKGFPSDLISAFERAIGRKVLGNKPASGTVIIEELGELHMITGFPIVYTSADSVFQIAAHEEIIPIEELYEMCRIARRMLVGKHNVARVIARPFVGVPGAFQRTPRRKDFPIEPHGRTVLEEAFDAGLKVIAIGKVGEMFSMRGISESIPTESNEHSLDVLRQVVRDKIGNIIFATLVDFDTKYGHRNDVYGFAKALMEFDEELGRLITQLDESELLIITADHGNDPTTQSTDHSREYVPLLVYNPRKPHGKPLGTRKTLADVAATIAEAFSLPKPSVGESFLREAVGEF
ncbi:MAG: phosphopentomutase [Armatimonadota bacterium]|nr:phosphopentomutase [Armatimonadota bacterium]MCX7777786.1 phosphopentomutase [Armatimonadota bacterium]MDW8025327.1 phosphopentomutase [Armatimonadota bacterium]